MATDHVRRYFAITTTNNNASPSPLHLASSSTECVSHFCRLSVRKISSPSALPHLSGCSRPALHSSTSLFHRCLHHIFSFHPVLSLACHIYTRTHNVHSSEPISQSLFEEAFIMVVIVTIGPSLLKLLSLVASSPAPSGLTTHVNEAWRCS